MALEKVVQGRLGSTSNSLGAEVGEPYSWYPGMRVEEVKTEQKAVA
jgi:hypothetical protein